MITFTEWLKQEASSSYAPVLNTSAGRVNSRPGATFLANRSQLWGPSAHFGEPDQMLAPHKKVMPAFLSAIGDSYRKSLGREIVPIPHLPHIGDIFTEEEDTVGIWVVLPLQLPPGETSGSHDYRSVQKMLNGFTDDPVIKPGEQPSQGKFVFPNYENYEEVEAAINFTRALSHLSALNTLKQKGGDTLLFKLEWQNPEIETRLNNGSLESLVVFNKVNPNENLGLGGNGAVKQYNNLAKKYGFEDEDNNSIPDEYDAGT